MRISVVTAVLNQAQFLPDMLRSLLAQRDESFEIEHIIVDGCSTDGTLDVIRQYVAEHPDIAKYISETDKSMYDALNKGIAMCTGDVFAHLNADDRYLPGALLKVARYYAAHPETAWLHARCRFIDETGRETRRSITRYKDFLGARYSYWLLLTENFVWSQTVFIRKAVLDTVGLFNLDYQIASDYDLWLRLGSYAQPAYLPELLTEFRWLSTSLGGSRFHQQFTEDFDIAKMYGRNYPLACAVHWLNKWKIIGIYQIMRMARTMQSRRSRVTA